MLMLPSQVGVYIATQAIDMRRSFDGLANIVSGQLGKDALSGSLFVFCNKRGDRVKILYWDRNGFAIWYKRLEQGVFRLPRVSGKGFQVSIAELNLILEGIDLNHKKRFRTLR